MKKIFKGMAILAATAALGCGVAFATACGGGEEKTKKVLNFTIKTRLGATINEYHELGLRDDLQPFEFKVSIGQDYRIISFKMVTDGSTNNDYAAKIPATFRDGSWFVGKNAKEIAETFNGTLGGIEYKNVKSGLESCDLTTGASQSSYMCIMAAGFATTNSAMAFGEAEVTSFVSFAEVIDFENTYYEIVEV